MYQKFSNPNKKYYIYIYKLTKINTYNMGTPQIICIITMGLNLLISAHLHGKERGTHNIFHTLINAGITIGLLYWGGFFTKCS